MKTLHGDQEREQGVAMSKPSILTREDLARILTEERREQFPGAPAFDPTAITQFIYHSKPGRSAARHPFPEPSGRVGGPTTSPYWFADREPEIRQWYRTRPGRGSRSDKRCSGCDGLIADHVDGQPCADALPHQPARSTRQRVHLDLNRLELEILAEALRVASNTVEFGQVLSSRKGGHPMRAFLRLTDVIASTLGDAPRLVEGPRPEED
jgi:hypothetical protein